MKQMNSGDELQLTIIIPVYNTEKYVDECVQSILSEMRESRSMELLLIDDGSIDNSLYRIEQYESGNVHVFHHDNQGVSYTRNVGIWESRGKYILFVDSDDRMISGWSETVLNACKTDYDVVYFSKHLAGINPTKDYITDAIFGIQTLNEGGMQFCSSTSRIFRRSFLQKNNILFCEKLVHGEDADFNVKSILLASTFGFFDSSIYNYRIYRGSSSRKYNEKFFDSSLEFLKRNEKALESYSGEEIHMKKDRYISCCLVNSVYLYIAFIVYDGAQTELRIKKCKMDFHNAEMQSFLQRYPTSKDCRVHVRLIYRLVRHGHVDLALWLVRRIKRIRTRKTAVVEKWDII